MRVRLAIACALLVAAGWAGTAHARSRADPACSAAAARPSASPRILRAIEEARRQHRLFGGQTIERDGGLYRVGYHEAEWDRAAQESTPTWDRVAAFWRALPELPPPVLVTSLGRVEQVQAAPTAAATAQEVAVREAVLRAAIVDTPWSAVFISYLMRTAGFSAAEFPFSDTHASYVEAAYEAVASGAAGREPSHALRACDVATTRPRAGDLLCATRAATASISRFDELPAALAAAKADGRGFPMHCDLVVRADQGGDAKLETIGGNVVQSVTLARMTLDGHKRLSRAYVAAPGEGGGCAGGRPGCRESLSRRPWVVLLRLRP